MKVWIFNCLSARFNAVVFNAIVKARSIPNVNYPPFFAISKREKQLAIIVRIACNDQRTNNITVKDGSEFLAFRLAQCCKVIKNFLNVRDLIAFAFLCWVFDCVSHKRHQRPMCSQVIVILFILLDAIEDL